MQEPSDQEILDLIRDEQSRRQGFNYLIQKYQKKIYWNIRRMVVNHDDADDLCQEVFIKVYRFLDNYRSDSSLYTWIYRISINETLTFLKQKQKRFFFSLTDYEHQLANTLQADPWFAGNEIQLRLQKAILLLPEKQRLVFNMKYFDDEMTFDKLSEVLETSVGALKASYHHAVKKIEKELTSV